MKEIFIGKWHLIFYKNYGKYILPTINYVPKTLCSCASVTFMWFRMRLTIFGRQQEKEVKEKNQKMISAISLGLTDVDEQRWKACNTTLKNILEWWQAYTQSKDF